MPRHRPQSVGLHRRAGVASVKPDPRFLRQDKRFWATVRLVSDQFGYSGPNEDGLSFVHAAREADIRKAIVDEGLDADRLAAVDAVGGTLLAVLADYIEYRAAVLNNLVRRQLMHMEDARREFERLLALTPSPRCKLPMNKQKGDKHAHAFFTCIVNLLIDQNLGDLPCDYDPGRLVTITDGNVPLRTFSRRFDGAFDCVRNCV